MSITNLHFKKLIGEYIKHFFSYKIRVRFIEKSSNLFIVKNKNLITFNTNVIKHVKEIYPKEAINFYDCLMVCCSHYLKEFLDDEEMLIKTIDALETINAPFRNDDVKVFLHKVLGYSPKANYKNLEIADDIVYYLKQSKYHYK